MGMARADLYDYENTVPQSLKSFSRPVDSAGLETYMARIPLTGIRRRIRARVGFACFGIAAALR
jgi:hypothetical protein